jgi:uncharacterized protein DUF3325
MAFTMIYLGWALLAISQPKHYGRIVRHGKLPVVARLGLRWLGAAVLLASLVMLVRAEGASFGALNWACLLSAGAIAVALTLAWIPRFTSRA